MPNSTCLLSDATLARIQFTIRTTPGQVPAFERKDIERKLAAAARRWDDELRDALVDAEGEAAGLPLFKAWGAAFPRDLPPPGCRARCAAGCAQARRLVAAGAAGPGAVPAGWRAARRARPEGLSPRRAAGAVGQPADARAHGRARDRRDRAGASRPGDAGPIALHDFKLAGAAHRRDRIRDAGPPVRRRFRPRLRGRRSKATTSTAWCCWPAWQPKRWWCCAPTPNISSRSALRNRRQPSQPRWPRTRAWRACWSACSSCASTRNAPTRRQPPRR